MLSAMLSSPCPSSGSGVRRPRLGATGCARASARPARAGGSLRVTFSAKQVTLHLRQDIAASKAAAGQDDAFAAAETIAIPWTIPAAVSVKGVVHLPAHNTPKAATLRRRL
jgi:hypothetical protein